MYPMVKASAHPPERKKLLQVPLQDNSPTFYSSTKEKPLVLLRRYIYRVLKPHFPHIQKTTTKLEDGANLAKWHHPRKKMMRDL